MTKACLYLCGVPGELGGACTKIRHLILLLKEDFRITVVLDDRRWLKNRTVTGFLKSHAIPYCLYEDIPRRTRGIALVICQVDFFTKGRAERLKASGLKVIFSNEMMWLFEGEAEAVEAGLIDKVLFVSDFQAAAFADLYRGIPSAIPGNYVSPQDFPFKKRRRSTFTIGRLSRPDLKKYPEDFPVFYEELGLKPVKYRVMAWDERLKHKYRWHRFGPEWDLLGPEEEPAQKFLYSLDLFVFPLAHTWKESWGRAVVEAMLTGAIPLVPAGHHFGKLLTHGESGFVCHDFSDYRDLAHELHDNEPLRQRLSGQCAEHARTRLCNAGEHRKNWIDALTVS